MHLTLLYHGVKTCGRFHMYLVDLIAQVSLTQLSSFLFLDVLTLKLRIIIIILPTDRPETTHPAALTTKN